MKRIFSKSILPVVMITSINASNAKHLLKNSNRAPYLLSSYISTVSAKTIVSAKTDETKSDTFEARLKVAYSLHEDIDRIIWDSKDIIEIEKKIKNIVNNANTVETVLKENEQLTEKRKLLIKEIIDQANSIQKITQEEKNKWNIRLDENDAKKVKGIAYNMESKRAALLIDLTDSKS